MTFIQLATHKNFGWNFLKFKFRKFEKSENFSEKKNLKLFRKFRNLRKMTNCKFHYTNYELTETRDSGFHFHSHTIFGFQNNDVSLSTIEDVIYDSWKFETMKMNFKRPRRRSVSVDTVEKLKNLTYSDKSIEELSKIPNTPENLEKKFKETYESPSSKLRTKNLKEIKNKIITINKTFSKRTRQSRIYFCK